jgi:hypothetical protein
MGIQMTKWIKIDRSLWGLSAAIIFFDKVSVYAGKSESWGIGVKVSFYDRSLTFEILNLYMGIEIFHKNYSEYDWSPYD